MDRGSATILGILFAFLASNIAARSDDAPGDLTKRISALATKLLDWSVRQLRSTRSDEPLDAPFTAEILGLAETCANATAERPALNRVKPWTQGLPTALLSLQSAVLSMRERAGCEDPSAMSMSLTTDALEGVSDSVRSSEALDLPSLRRRSSALAATWHSSTSRNSSQNEILDALMYLLAGLEAILTLSPPDITAPLYPPPKFVAHPRYAMTNLIRTIVGMGVGFLVWDITAWPQGPVFIVNIAVALVIFVALDDPVFANFANIIGTILGCLVGLVAKYFLLIGVNNSLNLVLVLFPLVFIGAWLETKGKLAPFGLFFVIGVLILIEPKNPQEYDFVHDINTLIAIELAYGFASLVFIGIGAPRKGLERVTELLARMRQYRRKINPSWTREQRLGWETRMYDELQRLQAVTKNPRHRACAVNLLISRVATT